MSYFPRKLMVSRGPLACWDAAKMVSMVACVHTDPEGSNYEEVLMILAMLGSVG